jgi:hypothetical protein
MVFEAQENLQDMAYDLIFKHKIDWATANRMAKEEYMFLPDEEDQPDLTCRA